MTPDRFKPLLDREFLKAELAYDYEDYLASGVDEALRERLAEWAKRELKRETQAEAAFTKRFFADLWGYRFDEGQDSGFELWPKFAIAGAVALAVVRQMKLKSQPSHFHASQSELRIAV